MTYQKLLEGMMLRRLPVRFGLRSLMILVTVSCVLVGAVLVPILKYHQQRAIAEGLVDASSGLVDDPYSFNYFG